MSQIKPWMIPSATIGSGALIFYQGHILLVQPNYGPAKEHWILPGGRVEAEESLTHALEREVKEESGLNVKAQNLIGVRQRFHSEGIANFYFLFEAEILNPHSNIKDFSFTWNSEELLDVRFWPTSESLKHPHVRPMTKYAIDLSLNKHNHSAFKKQEDHRIHQDDIVFSSGPILG